MPLFRQLPDVDWRQQHFSFPACQCQAGRQRNVGAGCGHQRPAWCLLEMMVAACRHQHVILPHRWRFLQLPEGSPLVRISALITPVIVEHGGCDLSLKCWEEPFCTPPPLSSSLH